MGESMYCSDEQVQFHEPNECFCGLFSVVRATDLPHRQLNMPKTILGMACFANKLFILLEHSYQLCTQIVLVCFSIYRT